MTNSSKCMHSILFYLITNGPYFLFFSVFLGSEKTVIFSFHSLSFLYFPTALATSSLHTQSLSFLCLSASLSIYAYLSVYLSVYLSIIYHLQLYLPLLHTYKHTLSSAVVSIQAKNWLSKCSSCLQTSIVKTVCPTAAHTKIWIPELLFTRYVTLIQCISISSLEKWKMKYFSH